MWSAEESTPDGCLEIHVTGSSRGVAAAKVAIADSLILACTTEFLEPPEKAPSPPPGAQTAPPYPAAAFAADWSHAATPWAAPWAMPLSPCSPSLAAQPYDYNSYSMQSQDMLLPGFAGGVAGASESQPRLRTPADAPSLPAADMQLVHYTQQIPHSLVGLVIGVKGASIHAVVRRGAQRSHA